MVPREMSEKSPLLKMSHTQIKNAVKNVGEALEKKEAERSSHQTRPERTLGESFEERILRNHPNLTREEVQEALDNLA